MNQYNAPNMNYLAPGLAGAQLCPASPDGVVRLGTCPSVPQLMDGSHKVATSQGSNVAAFCNIVDFLLGYMVKYLVISI